MNFLFKYKHNMENEPQPIDDLEKMEHFAKVRYAICRECQHFKMYICKKCGCFMPAKTQLRSVSCPIGLWGPEP